jgi:hypothetical protein
MIAKYSVISNKIRKLNKHITHVQTNNQRENIFYKRAENLSNVNFTEAEM